MSQMHLHRLDPSNPAHLAEWLEVFRRTPSFVYATEGKPPTDADAERLIHTKPNRVSSEDVYLFAVRAGGDLVGVAYVIRGYPEPGVAYLVLLVLAEDFQGRYLGVRCLRCIEDIARSWGCSRLAGVVDAENSRAAEFWKRLGFSEQSRRKVPGLVGEAIVGEKAIAS